MSNTTWNLCYFRFTSLMVVVLLVCVGDVTLSQAAGDKPTTSQALQRRLDKIQQRMSHIENRLVSDESLALAAHTVSNQNGHLATAVVEPPWLPSAPLQGRIVFEQKNCDRCHAISGAGGSIGPDLSKTFFRGSFLDLASMLWNHIPDMLVEYKTQKLPRPTYTEDDVANLISYLYYLRYLGSPGDLARGEKLLQEKGCLECHQSGPRLRDLAPGFERIQRYVSPLELAQALWNHEPKMDEMMRRLGIKRPSFNGQEISDLSAFIRAASRSGQTERIYVSPGNPQDGARVYQQKGCDTCHSRATGPSLANLPLHKSAADIAGMMWNHGDEMFEKMRAGAIPWPVFEGKEMADLIAFLYFVKFIEPPGNAVVGKTFFEEKKCIGCHSIQGVGGSLGPDLALQSTHTTNTAILAAMLNHSETMSEAILKKGEVWPLLNGEEMRDTFAYIKAVSGIKRAALDAATGPQHVERPLINGLPRPAPPVRKNSSRIPAAPTTDSSQRPTPSAGQVMIPDGYQVVAALLDRSSGDSLIQTLKASLGEEQLKRIRLSFHASPEFISKAGFTWTPQGLGGATRVHVFVPTLLQAELTVKLNGKTVWNPPDRDGQNMLSPTIDVSEKESALSITVDNRADENDINGGIDDIYVLRPKTN